jgi:hypothetical protein
MSVVNDFLYKGFPLLKSSPEAKKLKDKEKVDKCVEILSALMTNFIATKEKRGIISIPMFDSLDDYSKKLLGHIFASDSNLLIVGGVDDSAFSEEDEEFEGGVVSAFLQPFIGTTTTGQVEVKCLNTLDRQATFDLFTWVLRRDFPSEVQELSDNLKLQHKISVHCEGMVHVTAELAQTFYSQLRRELESKKLDFDLSSYLSDFLDDTPNNSEEIISFRFDKMTAEEQMLLKIASVAGFDQYSFSQNLLETVLLALSRVDMSTIDEDDEIVEGKSDDGNEGVPLSVGGDIDVPMNIGVSNSVNKYDYMFQGNFFEQTLDSLVEQKFLAEVNVEMSDLTSMDSVMYRFRSIHELSVINGLMLNDQKQRTHFEVALYYQSTHGRETGESSASDSDELSGSLSTDITIVPTTNWQLYHITALHFDLAGANLPALLQYYESSTQLAWLGMRDRAHGGLLSAYLMLEKMLHDTSVSNIYIDEATEQRQKVASQMVQIIGNKELSEALKGITKEHLRNVFDGDIIAFKTTLSMLTKFGQSVGTIEKEGYKFGSELYLQAILLVLLVLDDDAFTNLTSRVASYLEETDLQERKDSEVLVVDESNDFDSDTLDSDDMLFNADFNMDDLTVSFPAFSGLLTFYRDSPIGANQVQETFLANLFVAVTQEANEMIHVLRTKCTISHLYLKHGDIDKALEECEGIMDIYDPKYNLQLSNTYGMDWPLICVGTMASTYLFRGQLVAAQRCIDFLTEQMQVIDEFVSSTKVMSKGTVSSYYLLLYDLSTAAEMSSGIATTQYGYFFKEHGTLQEVLAMKELALQNHDTFDGSEIGSDLLSVLSSNDINKAAEKRSMLRQSAETLCDRGVEAIQAAICLAEVKNLDSMPFSVEVATKQLQYCQAGLIYLNQTLLQNDANNHERRKNYLMGLHQKAHLLYWHQKTLNQLGNDYDDDDTVNDILGLKGREMDHIRQCLIECEELSKEYDYLYMLLLVGKTYVNLKIDEASGEDLITCTLDKLAASDRPVAEELLARIDTYNMR